MKGVIFIGLQGSGKSTFYFEQFANTHMRLNMDMLRTRHREKLLFNACLEAKQPCVIDNTNPTKVVRQRYIEEFKNHRFDVTGYFFQSCLADCLERNALREGKERIPDAGLRNTSRQLELPSLAEGFDELYFVSIVEDKYIVRSYIEKERL